LDVGQESDAHRPGWQLYRGAKVTPFGTTFSVWAPKATTMSVHIATGDAAGDYPLGLAEGQRGVWEVAVPGVKAGDLYGYSIDDGDPLPDPVSRSQPEGVHGLSEVIDPSRFVWTDDQWRG